MKELGELMVYTGIIEPLTVIFVSFLIGVIVGIITPTITFARYINELEEEVEELSHKLNTNKNETL